MRSASIVAGNWLFSLLLLLLSGCGGLLNFAYNNADSAAYWYFDDYFEFNADQKTQFDQGFRRIHAWHRSTELPRYAALCSEAALRVEAGVGQADLDWFENEVRARFNALASVSGGELASVLAAMEPAQLASFEQKLEKSNAKFRQEHLFGTLEEREKKRLREALARIEDWVGDLSSDQEASIREKLKGMPRMAEHRYAQRLARQKALREILSARLKKNDLETALRQWTIHWESGRTAEHQRLWGQWLGQNRRLILELTAMLTAEQRTHLVNKLRDYAQDFDKLHQSG